MKNKKFNFFQKSFFSLLMVTLSIILLLTVFLTLNYLKASLSITSAFNQNLLSQTNYSVTNMNENAKRLTQALYNDKDIISFLHMDKGDNLTPILASRALDRQTAVLSYIDSVYLYNANLDLFFSSKTGEQLSAELFPDKNITELILNPNSSTFPKQPIIYNNGIISYVYFDTNLWKSPLKNAVVINVNPSYLTESLLNISHFKDEFLANFIVMDSNGNVLSAAVGEELKDVSNLFPTLKNAVTNQETPENMFLMLGDTKYFVSFSNSNENGWFLISLVPNNVIFKDILAASLAGTLIVLIIVLFSFGLCLFLAKKLNRPIQSLTRLVSGQEIDTASSNSMLTEEFSFLATVFQTMKEQNRQLDKLKKETAYSIKQDFLNMLVTGNYIDTPEKTKSKLESLNLSYLSDSPLCMCVFKIDGYHKFYAGNNQGERWALRFAIVNISEELSSESFKVETFSHDSDKFIMLIKCSDVSDYKQFSEKLRNTLLNIQTNVENHLHLTLSVAYSTLFQGIEHLHTMYRNMEESLLLKIKYGHNCIISPYTMDELDTDNFQFPAQKLEQLVTKIAEGNSREVQSLYLALSSQLFQHSYNEIMSGMIYMMYSIYTELSCRYSALKDNLGVYMKEFLLTLPEAETSEELDGAMENFLTRLCTAVTDITSSASYHNTEIVTARICEIISNEYTNNALCLSSIAEQIGLSSNYAGQIFKAATGKSVAQYILDLRMDMLSDYMKNSKLPLNTIIERVGLEKNNYFYTRFKKHFGVSLGEYKLQGGAADNI